MGRVKDVDVWKKFSQPYSKVGNKTKFVRCKHCCKEIAAASVTRLKVHLENCKYSAQVTISTSSDSESESCKDSSAGSRNPEVKSDDMPAASNTTSASSVTITSNNGSLSPMISCDSTIFTRKPGCSGYQCDLSKQNNNFVQLQTSKKSVTARGLDFSSKRSMNFSDININPKSAKVNIKSFTDSMTRADMEKGNKLFVRMVASANLPFNIVENKEFIDFIHFLRPAFQIPKRHAIVDNLMPELYNEIHTEVMKHVEKANTLSLVTDGWSNIRGDSIVGYVVTTPQPLFWKCHNITNEIHTGEFIASKLEEIISELNPQKVTAVVSDNAANMKSACAILCKKYPWIISFGCLSHIGNLICKDACDVEPLKSTLSSCKDVVKFFKDHYIAKSVHEKNQCLKGVTTTLKLPVSTRWGSALDCVASVYTNREALIQCAVDDTLKGKLPNTLKQLLIADKFWEDIKLFCDTLGSLVELIHYFEADTPRLSTAYEKLMNIKNHFMRVDNISQRLEAIFDSKWRHVNTNLLMLSNTLDPKSKGSQVPPVCMPGVRAYIASIIPASTDQVKLIGDLAQYLTKSGNFAEDIMWQQAESSISPITWWKVFGALTPELSDLAIRILSIPCSSAAIERIWSTYGFLHSKVRNRLTDVNASRLLYTHANIQLLSPRDL